MRNQANDPNSRGNDLANRLKKAVGNSLRVLRNGARELPAVQGMMKDGSFWKPMENVLDELQELLVKSGRLYRRGDGVSMEVEAKGAKRLESLPLDTAGIGKTAACLANLFVCEVPPAKEGGAAKQFAPTPGLVGTLFRREPTLKALPQVKVYSRRPVYDKNFVLRGPGYHADCGIPVHGDDIDVSDGAVAGEGRATC